MNRSFTHRRRLCGRGGVPPRNRSPPQPRRDRLGGPVRVAQRAGVVGEFRPLHRPQPAAADELAGGPVHRHRPLLTAHLQRPPAAGHGVHQPPALGDANRDRFFEVDVQPRLQGVQGGGDVVVVRGGDDHRVQPAGVDHPPVVLERAGRTAVRGGEGAQHVPPLVVGPQGLRDAGAGAIADRGDLRGGRQTADQVPPPHAAADQPDPQPRVGRAGERRPGERPGGRGGGRGEKPAAGGGHRSSSPAA